ncbi:MAG: hypothetical protein KGM42_17155 [Hyphomicrobiales bacterium]|nr:hypothetical protein [Hyphomicrobiales bacterium]
MKPFSAQALQLARQAAAVRYQAIAVKHTPDDVEVVYRKRLTGCAWARSRRIAVPRPVTRRALHVYLHEVAHVVLRHYHDRPVHVQEYEAEQWAFAVMRAEGVPIPRASVRRAKAYVAHTILRELARGCEPIHLPAARFANIAPDQTTSLR